MTDVNWPGDTWNLHDQVFPDREDVCCAARKDR